MSRVIGFEDVVSGREEAQQNAMAACSHMRFDIQTCLELDLRSGRNDPSDNSLHLKYMKALRRITGCSMTLRLTVVFPRIGPCAMPTTSALVQPVPAAQLSWTARSRSAPKPPKGNYCFGSSAAAVAMYFE
jgi:hypothetical protein